MADLDEFDFDALGDSNDAIPCRGAYRGVPLHDGQSAARLRVVRRDIDRVFALKNVDELADLAGDVRRAPESRLFAAAKLEAVFQDAVEKRHERPPFDRARVKLMVNALDSLVWRDPFAYGTLLDGRAGKVPRETPLGEDE